MLSLFVRYSYLILPSDAILQVLMKVEQDQKLTEDARVSAEQDAAAQKYAVHVLQVLCLLQTHYIT